MAAPQIGMTYHLLGKDWYCETAIISTNRIDDSDDPSLQIKVVEYRFVAIGSTSEIMLLRESTFHKVSSLPPNRKPPPKPLLSR